MWSNFLFSKCSVKLGSRLTSFSSCLKDVMSLGKFSLSFSLTFLLSDDTYLPTYLRQKRQWRLYKHLRIRAHSLWPLSLSLSLSLTLSILASTLSFSLFFMYTRSSYLSISFSLTRHIAYTDTHYLSLSCTYTRSSYLYISYTQHSTHYISLSLSLAHALGNYTLSLSFSLLHIHTHTCCK